MDNNLNQNNTNGTNMNLGGMAANPVPPQPEIPSSPVPQEPFAPVSPVTNETVSPVPPVTLEPTTPAQPVAPEPQTMAQNPMPDSSAFSMPTPPPVENTNPQPSVNPMENINLQPEGVVTPMPETIMQTPAAPEPLMSTPLNENTNLNQNVGMASPGDMNMNNNAFGNNQGMGMDPNMNANPMGMNQVGATPMNNPIDMMGVPTPPPLPPEDTKKKKKKGNNKAALIILIVVLIAGVGFGLYYVLVMSKETTSASVRITPTLTEVERGLAVELIASNFATVTNYDINSCTVETDLDTLTVGTYQYTVSCGNETASQTVTVTDTSAPFATVREVIVSPGEEVTPQDFIYGIDEDIANCTFAFVNPVDTSAVGTQEVEITISDEYENETTVTGTLTVADNAPQTYLYCASDDTTTEKSYRFAIDASGNLYNAKNLVTYTYEDEAAYSSAIREYRANGSLNNTTGIATFDSYNLQITIMSDADTTALATEFNLSVFPTTQTEIEALFPNGCDIGTN